MESKLLVGGKNIIDHTNEQQKMLELKRHEIAEQVKHTNIHTHIKHQSNLMLSLNGFVFVTLVTPFCFCDVFVCVDTQGKRNTATGLGSG